MGASILHNLGQFAGHTLNALPGYSTLGANITNPNINYKGALNPPTPSNNFYTPSTGSAPNNPQVLGAETNADPYSYGGSSSGIDPATGLSYDYLAKQAQAGLDSLGQQQTVGNQNIMDAYNTQYNSLQGQKALTDRNYNTSKDQQLQDYTTARGNNQAAVGQQGNSLQRLLGSHGYHGSANVAAGYATALQGTNANNQLEQGYGRNQQALDTTYGDYNNQFGQSIASLANQKDQQQRSLQAQVEQTKQGLLSQLAQIAAARGRTGASTALQTQANSLTGDITQLGQTYANPVLQATAPVYQAPTLESYTATPNAAPVISDSPAAGNIDPAFLNVLLGQPDKKDLQGQVL